MSTAHEERFALQDPPPGITSGASNPCGGQITAIKNFFQDYFIHLTENPILLGCVSRATNSKEYIRLL